MQRKTFFFRQQKKVAKFSKEKNIFLHLQHLFTYRINSFSCAWGGKGMAEALFSPLVIPMRYSNTIFFSIFSSFKCTMNGKENFSYSSPAVIWCWKSLDKRNLTNAFWEKSRKFIFALIFPTGEFHIDWRKRKFAFEWKWKAKKNDI